MRKALNKLLFFLLILLSVNFTYGQDDSAIGYKKNYDDPYDINKLFVAFIPIYGEVAATNMTIGYGFQIDYYHENKFDLSFHTRKSYGERTDIMRDAAEKNTTNSNSNSPNVYNFLELGGTYHWRDFEEEKTTKVFLYDKSDKGSKWESMVIKTSEVTGKVRKIYGARLGGLIYDTSFDMNRALERQGTTLVDSDGVPIDDNAVLFGNVKSAGGYIGASMSWFRNFSIDFERKYSPGGDDLLLTSYLDILFGSAKIEDIFYQGEVYSSSPVDVNNIGMRLGIQGKFNRTLSWGYGAEIGYRPSVKKQAFFLLFKLSFPVYGTNLNYGKVQSVEQE